MCDDHDHMYDDHDDMCDDHDEMHDDHDHTCDDHDELFCRQFILFQEEPAARAQTLIFQGSRLPPRHLPQILLELAKISQIFKKYQIC